eukprot:TRINITY_DN1341_c0_g1_i2.p1 TRINITY_DN1341_c0_g1~~TRINITY_DN1341_c0_g1_i2.p1  ORF type:complete len:549 (-),score=180.76 TRINITY_DN1341_c0_g1_i2:388-2034(-)
MIPIRIETNESTWGITSCHKSPKLFVSSNSHNITMCPLDTENVPRSTTILGGHDNNIPCVCVSPDDKYLVSGSIDCSIKLWDIETKKELKRIIFPNWVWSTIWIKKDTIKLNKDINPVVVGGCCSSSGSSREEDNFLMKILKQRMFDGATQQMKEMSIQCEEMDEKKEKEDVVVEGGGGGRGGLSDNNEVSMKKTSGSGLYNGIGIYISNFPEDSDNDNDNYNDNENVNDENLYDAVDEFPSGDDVDDGDEEEEEEEGEVNEEEVELRNMVMIEEINRRQLQLRHQQAPSVPTPPTTATTPQPTSQQTQENNQKFVNPFRSNDDDIQTSATNTETTTTTTTTTTATTATITKTTSTSSSTTSSSSSLDDYLILGATSTFFTLLDGNLNELYRYMRPLSPHNFNYGTHTLPNFMLQNMERFSISYYFPELSVAVLASQGNCSVKIVRICRDRITTQYTMESESVALPFERSRRLEDAYVPLSGVTYIRKTKKKNDYDNNNNNNTAGKISDHDETMDMMMVVDEEEVYYTLYILFLSGTLFVYDIFGLPN